jgi:hypothetical protein
VYVNDADLTDDRDEYYGVYHAATGVAAKSVGIGYCYKNSYYVGTAATAIGFHNSISAKVADNINGIEQVLHINAAGSAQTLNIHAAVATVASVETARIEYASLSVSSAANVLGAEHTVLYQTCAGWALGGINRLSGSNVQYVGAFWAENDIATSAQGAYGVVNLTKYRGAPAIPDFVYGLWNGVSATNGALVNVAYNEAVVSSASRIVAVSNSVYATKAQKIYGIAQTLSNGDVDACNEIIGIYTKLHGGNASQNTVVGNWIEATGVVNGNVYGEFISAKNEDANKTAYGIYAEANAATGIGVYATAPTRAYFGSVPNTNAKAAEFIAATGTAVSAYGLYQGMYITAGKNDRVAQVIGAYITADNNAFANQVWGVYATVANAGGALATALVGAVAGALNIGVAGFAQSGVGVYGSAINTAAQFTAQYLGVSVKASTAGNALATVIGGYYSATNNDFLGCVLATALVAEAPLGTALYISDGTLAFGNGYLNNGAPAINSYIIIKCGGTTCHVPVQAIP